MVVAVVVLEVDAAIVGPRVGGIVIATGPRVGGIVIATGAEDGAFVWVPVVAADVDVAAHRRARTSEMLKRTFIADGY